MSQVEKPSLERLRIVREAPARRPGGGVAWVIAGLLLLLGAGAWWWAHRPKPLAVETAIVHRPVTGAGPRTVLNASGYVTARRAATVSSKVTGKVVEVLVEEGLKVAEGQVLARLDATNVEASLHLAEAQLEASRTMLEETKPNLDFARRELKRFSDLSQTRVVSESDLARREMEAFGLQARVARQAAEVAVRAREIEQWKQQIEDTIIRAPFAGMVTSKNAQPGEMISPMSVGGFTRTGICTIVDMSSLEVEVDVNESYIQRVRPNLPVEATLDAYPNWHIPSRVLAIIPTADRQKATVKVRVAFAEQDERILPEMGVKVAFQTGAEEKNAPAVAPGVALAKTAVQEEGGREIVWVVQEGGRLERRAISTRPAGAEELLVLSGLQEGERVVLRPARDFAEGLRVSFSQP